MCTSQTFRLKVRFNIEAKSDETQMQVTIRTACHCGRIGQVQILSYIHLNGCRYTCTGRSSGGIASALATFTVPLSIAILKR